MNQNSSGFLSSIPMVTKNLIIINLLFWVASLVLPKVGIDLVQLFGLHFPGVKDFYPFQFVTYMFMHDTHSFAHVFFNMCSDACWRMSGGRSASWFFTWWRVSGRVLRRNWFGCIPSIPSQVRTGLLWYSWLQEILHWTIWLRSVLLVPCSVFCWHLPCCSRMFRCTWCSSLFLSRQNISWSFTDWPNCLWVSLTTVVIPWRILPTWAVCFSVISWFGIGKRKI